MQMLLMRMLRPTQVRAWRRTRSCNVMVVCGVAGDVEENKEEKAGSSGERETEEGKHISRKKV